MGRFSPCSCGQFQSNHSRVAIAEKDEVTVAYSWSVCSSLLMASIWQGDCDWYLSISVSRYLGILNIRAIYAPCPKSANQILLTLISPYSQSFLLGHPHSPLSPIPTLPSFHFPFPTRRVSPVYGYLFSKRLSPTIVTINVFLFIFICMPHTLFPVSA